MPDNTKETVGLWEAMGLAEIRPKSITRYVYDDHFEYIDRSSGVSVPLEPAHAHHLLRGIAEEWLMDEWWEIKKRRDDTPMCTRIMFDENGCKIPRLRASSLPVAILAEIERKESTDGK